ncbi:hypothetical protein [Kineobactrum salinum]|uniref:Class IIb bacteriocin, lactobin A/cerein 7B family n=1 Tax=Kineobactrum salinum TaxID=2708301 RepID=A0A6C0U1D3_9GAMM|nr:hypothetical protein [Kineobactrum salinum]QIB65708.1 hypothetical protein G3T16_10065 [Kineobactrum salinum]
MDDRIFSFSPEVATAPVELTESDIDNVSGGILPAIGVAAALASHIGVGGVATSVTTHLLSGFGLGYAVFGAASYYGGGGVKTKKDVASH